MVYSISKYLLFFIFITFFILPTNNAFSSASKQSTTDDDTVTKVICNVVVFVQKLGLPIMTGVILGSSIMAIFGRLPWPAIVMLVVFTAIFFGAGKLISKFAGGIDSVKDGGQFDCGKVAGTSS
ncbi:type VI secretion protein [Ehrlichia minasensis]|uniref:Type VI secretion protein n=1 Tax=Ehrlichia minasensis TaxID=1242993 RepID=A0A4Q6I9I2_9RICK|nr:TrbC/VirB2 family protein [Ehrlichia minasensis]RZB12677.1 type VI secretion protein [Ehrlichia minasensis]